MDYSKFYTPPKIAELLVSQIRIKEPENVIDICCGSCNLLHAAKKKWHKAILTGVDVNATQDHSINFIEQDGREFSLSHSNEYSLVLANPPFDYNEKRNQYPELFKGLNFSFRTSRLEIEMLLANLNILAENGTLLIIMPSTFVDGQNNKKLKCYLAREYYIQKIIHLPDNAFGNTNISTCALVVTKKQVRNKTTKRYYVESENNRFTISTPPTIVPNSMMESGYWNDSHSCNNLRTIGVEIKRGNISSQYFVENGKHPVLHTAKLNTPWVPSVRYISKIKQNAIYAEDGDIIISRIGKSAGQWHKYQGERMMVSDCIYVIKDSDNSIYRLLEGKEYSLPCKGVATKYITITDFQNWIQSLKA